MKAALAAARADEARTLAEQVEICEVEAPPFKESSAAEVYARKFASWAAERAHRHGRQRDRRAAGTAPRPHVVLAAHLDTVFPEGTNVKVKREGTVMRGPGIGDDCRGLAVVLAVVRAFKAGNVQTTGTVTFVGNVGEEGLGNLRGVQHLFNEGLKGRIDYFISVDGTGLGITHIAVGSNRYRVTYKGPGGHSYGAFGMANPIHALGRAMREIADFQVPNEPKTTFNVGRVGGGTSVNSIPFEAWMEVDMRSADPASLQSLDAKFQKAVDDAVAAENARWNSRAITVDKALVGIRPAGATPATRRSCRRRCRRRERWASRAPTRARPTRTIPMSLGIPAITIDGGGGGRGAHALDESYDTTDSWMGTQRAMLLAIALAQQ